MNAKRGTRTIAAIAVPTLVAGVALAAPAAAADAASQSGSAAAARARSVTLGINDDDGQVRTGRRLTFRGVVRHPQAGDTVRLQRKAKKAWRTVKRTTHDGHYKMRLPVPEGRNRYRSVVSGPNGPLVSRPVVVRATDADFTGMTMPQDQQQVIDAITSAKNSVEIVIYDFGAADIIKALQQAKANLAANKPTKPVIRVMVNNQWYGASGAASHYAYVQKAAKALDIGTDGMSDDGVVQFNYTADNFSLTHQKTILIDTLRPDGTDYTEASDLPSSARAIVATFNLQAYGWATEDTGCTNNPSCGFAGGNPGTRDFGIVANDPTHVWEIQQVYASDFAGPTPTQTNSNLGLNDPTSNLVWSNGTTGILVPPPSGTAALYSPTAGAYPATSPTASVGSGFYPSSYYRFAQDAAVAGSGIELGSVQGNANAVHLQIIEAATSAAQDGEPATLYIYNEEYNDDQILDAIQDAAAAGVSVRIVMTYSSGNGANYDYLVKTKLTKGGGPVDAQVHLLPNASPQYMYIHAKMIYADLPQNQDVAFVGSQNFSPNSLLYNREAGVQLKWSDGSLTPALKSMLTGTFQNDFSLTGANTTWTFNGATLPCPVVTVTPQETWASQKANLYPGPSYKDATNAGCQTKASVTQPDTERSVLQAVPRTIESWRGSSYPSYGTTATGNFGPPLANVTAEYNPPMPQGPINPTNMVPGNCVLIDQTTGGSAGACPPPS